MLVFLISDIQIRRTKLDAKISIRNLLYQPIIPVFQLHNTDC